MIDRSDLPDLAWARDISKLDDDHLKAHLAQLPVAGQVGLWLAVDWQERMRIIKTSDQAGQLVRALPDEDVLLTIKAVGEEDSLPLVALTTPEQLRFLLDVELWERDSLDEEKVIVWIRNLLACGETKVIEFVKNSDTELVAIILNKLVQLIPEEEGVKIPEGLPTIMADDYFTVLCRLPDETETIRLLLRILRQWDRSRFYRLLFAAYGEVGAETEDKALRWRKSRLEEKGILDFDEAIEIYGYIDEDEARAIARSPGRTEALPESAGAVPPAYPLLLAEGRTFFYKVLSSVRDPSLQNRLRTEIAFAANRLLAADAEKLGELDSVRRALNRFFSLSNVGLLFLAGGETQEAVAILERVPVREIFQIGFSRVIDLKSAAGEVIRKWWPKWREEGLVFLGFPKDEILRGLMMRVPQYYALVQKAPIDFRDFETMEEVDQTRHIVEEIAVVAETCFDRVGIPRPHEAKPSLADVSAGGIEEITLRNLLLTGWINFVLKGELAISPLRKSDIKEMFDKVLERTASGDRLVRKVVVDRFLARLRELTGFEETKWDVLRSFINSAVGALQEEVAGIPSYEDLDPRYVSTLIFGRWH